MDLCEQRLAQSQVVELAKSNQESRDQARAYLEKLRFLLLQHPSELEAFNLIENGLEMTLEGLKTDALSAKHRLESLKDRLRLKRDLEARVKRLEKPFAIELDGEQIMAHLHETRQEARQRIEDTKCQISQLRSRLEHLEAKKDERKELVQDVLASLGRLKDHMAT